MLSRAALWEHIKQRRERKLQAEATVGFRAEAVAECQGLEWEVSAWERGGSLERHNFLFCHCDTNTAEFFWVQSSLSLSYLGDFIFCIYII